MSTNNQILRVRLPEAKAKLIQAAASMNGLSTSSYLKTVLYGHIARKLEPAMKRTDAEAETV